MKSPEQKLRDAFNELLKNSIDSIGLPKKATIKQLKKAVSALSEWDKHIKSL